MPICTATPISARTNQAMRTHSRPGAGSSGYTTQTSPLAAADGLQGFDSLTHFCERMPFTTKDELARDQRAQPPYGSTLTYPVSAYTRFHQTSGTGGRPLIWLDTRRAQMS